MKQYLLFLIAFLTGLFAGSIDVTYFWSRENLLQASMIACGWVLFFYFLKHWFVLIDEIEKFQNEWREIMLDAQIKKAELLKFIENELEKIKEIYNIEEN